MENDKEIWTFIQKLQQDPSASNTFRWEYDLLRYKDHLYLGKISHLKQKILFEFHSSLIGGNSGFLKPYHRVKKDFFGMVLKMTFKYLWQNVWFSTKINWKQLRPLVSYNHFPFQAKGGQRS